MASGNIIDNLFDSLFEGQFEGDVLEFWIQLCTLKLYEFQATDHCVSIQFIKHMVLAKCGGINTELQVCSRHYGSV